MADALLAVTVTAPDTFASVASTPINATPEASVSAEPEPSTAPDPKLIAKFTTRPAKGVPLALV